MSLFVAIITFFIIILMLSVTRNVFFLVLTAFIASFITMNLASIFNEGTSFTTTFSGGISQQMYMEMAYGILTFVAFGKAAVSAFKSQMFFKEVE